MDDRLGNDSIFFIHHYDAFLQVAVNFSKFRPIACTYRSDPDSCRLAYGTTPFGPIECKQILTDVSCVYVHSRIKIHLFANGWCLNNGWCLRTSHCAPAIVQPLFSKKHQPLFSKKFFENFFEIWGGSCHPGPRLSRFRRGQLCEATDARPAMRCRRGGRWQGPPSSQTGQRSEAVASCHGEGLGYGKACAPPRCPTEHPHHRERAQGLVCATRHKVKSL